MSLRQVVEAFGRTPFAEAVLRAIPGRGSVARLGGLPGSSPAVLTAWLACELPDRLLIVVAPTPADAERWISDLSQLTDLPIALYPQREALGEEEPHLEIAGQRAETLEALLHGQLRILVSTARGTAERTQVPAALDRLRLELSVGFDVPLSEITSALEGMGFRRVPTVTAVAEYAVRGGIIDLYGFGMAAPARCEWWGDRIDSLRSFDLTTQRSGDALDRITVLPIQTQAVEPQTDRPPDRRTLLELLPGDALILEERATVDEEEIERTWRDAEHHLEVARKLGEDVPSRDAIFQAPEDWKALREGFPRLLLDSPDPEIQAGFFPPERINRDLRALRLLLRSPTPTVILCDNEGQLERLMELLEDPRGETPATLVVGAVDGGFVMPTLRVLTDHEIFRRARRLRRARRYREATPSAVTGELGPGDYVVHLDHGIGIYRGLTSIDIGGGGGRHLPGGRCGVRRGRQAQCPPLWTGSTRAVPVCG